MSQPDPTGESPVTTAKPLARYRAVEGARASGFAIPQLHHRAGHDPDRRRDVLIEQPVVNIHCRSRRCPARWLLSN